MIGLLCSFLINCPMVIIENKTNEWIGLDEENLIIAKERCRTWYPNSPCLIKFIKVEDRTYRALCGGNK